MSKLFLFSKVKEMKMKIPKGYISGTLLGHGHPLGIKAKVYANTIDNH